MYLNGGMMIVLGYIIGYMFGQMNIKAEMKEQGIRFESKKPSFFSRIMDMVVGQAKSKPTKDISQNINQPPQPMPPPVPENRNNFKNK